MSWMLFSGQLPALLTGLLFLSSPASAGEQPAAQPDPQPKETKKLSTTELIVQALPKNVTMDIQGQTLHEVLGHVSKRTNIPIVLDTNNVMTFPGGMIGGFGIAGGGFAPGMPGMNAGPMTLSIKNAPLGTGLKKFLQTRNLTFAVVDGKLAVTNAQQALVQQMRQTVDVHFDNVPVHKALHDLARQTGTHIMLDAESEKDAKITLKLSGVSVETAVRLVAFKAGLKSVRVDDMIVVATRERAALLPAETPLPQVHGGHFQDVNDINANNGGGGVPGVPGFAPAGGAGFAPPGIAVPVAPAQPAAPPQEAPRRQ